METENSNNTAVAEIHATNIDFMMGLNELKARANMVTDIKRQIMKKDIHWGQVPGCGPKPTLLKNGAELLCMAFKLASDARVEVADLGNGHREYTVTTTLTSIVTGTPVATGLGSCSTMESKYRYRGTELENTGKPVPSSYWADRDPAKIGGKGFVAKKDDNGKWCIFKKGDRKIENPDIADSYNTVLKMAAKRSLVDATLKATGGSCEFTQDIEDMGPADYSSPEPADFQVMDEQPAQPAAPAAEPAAPRKEATRKPKKDKGDEDQQKEAFAKMMDDLRKDAPETFDQCLKFFGYETTAEVPAERRKEVFRAVKAAVSEPLTPEEKHA